MSDIPSPPPPPPGGAVPPPPPPSGSSGEGPGTTANFGKRLGGYLIDWLIVGIPSGVLFFILVEVLPREEPELCEIDGELFICENLTGASWAILILIMLAVTVAVAYLYYGKPEGTTGQTVGKRTVGIKVVDFHTGEPIGVGRGVGRWFARIVSSIPCGLGFLWAIWDKDGQTWHDKMTTSRVIEA